MARKSSPSHVLPISALENAVIDAAVHVLKLLDEAGSAAVITPTGL